ncbi:uncharacterized protein LOC129224989 [Uloborus diversus]|uniref:uncharacterized protein LOC129224989 n=1 Tax=Uloborus diversus TaxID=327109 RepID=UPI00240A7D0B|nr:uncharacterized protein LOC129224989 [Uloborus diversus]
MAGGRVDNTSNLSQEAPKISKIVESLKQYEVFKYSAYRTAYKIRTIQKASKLHMIDLSLVNSVFKDYESGNQSINELISAEKAENLISTLYVEAGKKVGFAEEPNVMSRLFLSFLQNTFIEDEKPLHLVQLKITLTLFAAAKLSEKYKYLFHHCSTGNTMSKQNLKLLLKSLSQLAEVVGEQVTFGSHLVSTAVRHCLKFCKNKVTEKRFRKWLSLEPQTTVWISTLHRIAVSETILHPVCCDFCTVNPIQGLRYRCLHCINYNLCSNCFLRGHVNKNHKESHLVHEFCYPASAWQETKATMTAIKNKLPFARCPQKSYLSFDEETFCESMPGSARNSVRNSVAVCGTLKKTTGAYVIRELTSIITKIENEKRQWHFCHWQIFTAAEKKKKEDLEENKDINLKNTSAETCNFDTLQCLDYNLDIQLGRLKDLLKNLKTPKADPKETGVISPVPHVPFSMKDHYLESTPVNSAVLPEGMSQQFKNLCMSSLDSTEKQRGHSSLNLSSDCETAISGKQEFDSSAGTTSPLSQNPSISLGLTRILNGSTPSNLSIKLAEFEDDASKISPIYLYSASEFNDTTEQKLSGNSVSRIVNPEDLSPVKTASSNFVFSQNCSLTASPTATKDAQKYTFSKNHSLEVSPTFKEGSSKFIFSKSGSLEFSSNKQENSNFAFNSNGSLETMELELKAMIQHLEDLLPQISVLSNDSVAEKSKVVSALSEMEEAVQKLSHLSIELSTGSTDL